MVFKRSTLTPSEMAVQESILARLTALEEQVRALTENLESEETDSDDSDN